MRAGAALTSVHRALPLLLLLLTLACGRDRAGVQLDVHRIVVGNQRIEVEVAATEAHRRLGLMHRTSLPEDHGMLFIFPTEEVRSFWMKNTLIPLSIAFADAGGRIVHIADMEPHSLESVWSQRPAKLALEMSQGWFARRGVFVGDVIQKIPRLPVE